MIASTAWPAEDTLIPDLLRQSPQARPVLDRYGLRGCGGEFGPHETLGFFARAHDVPIALLLRELQDGLSRNKPAVSEPVPSEPTESRPALGDAIYRPFFKGGIAVILTVGAVWGAWLLLQIAWHGSFTAAGIHQVNAHGHAQIFGWIGLFVMGFAYQAFPRFKHTELSHPRLAYATLGMMLGGLVARSAIQTLAGAGAWVWWLAVVASAVETAAVVLFVAILSATWRRSGKSFVAYDYYILSALGWFVVQAVYESVYLAATLTAEGDRLLALVSTWQAPLRDVQIHGFGLMMVLGVSQRIFHHFYNLPEPSRRLSLALLPVLNLAVVGEAAGLLLMRLQGHAWAALWYGAVLVLLTATAALVANWRIWSPATDADRSLKFLRTAYGWLFLSLGMLAALPLYQHGVLAWLAPTSEAAQLGFSHAYYGATRHAITVGFLSLMIVGVAAKVVPTLGGLNPRALTSLWAPFLLINLGCTLRVVGQTLTDVFPGAFPVAGVSGLLEVTGLTIWGVHLWRVMNGRYASQLVTAAPAPGEPVRAEHGVGAVLEQRPELLDVFLEHGFTPLAKPHLRKTIARVVTIEQACRRFGVNVNTFLAVLNEHSQPTLSSCSTTFIPREALTITKRGG